MSSFVNYAWNKKGQPSHHCCEGFSARLYMLGAGREEACESKKLGKTSNISLNFMKSQIYLSGFRNYE